MREASSFLTFLTGKISTAVVDGACRHVSTATTHAGGIVRGPGELVVGSPKFVELQSEFRAAGIGSLRRHGSFVRDGTDAVTVTRRGGRSHAIVWQSVHWQLSISEFPIITCKE